MSFFARNNNSENIREFDDEVSRLAAAKERAEQDKAECLQEIRRMEAQIRQLRSEGSNAQREIRGLISAMEVAQERCQSLNRKFDEIQRDYRLAQEQLREAKRTGKLLAAEVTRLKEQNRRHEMEVAALKERLEEQQRKIEALQRELEEVVENEKRRRRQNPFLAVAIVVGSALTLGALAALLFTLILPGTALVLVCIGVLVAAAAGLYAVFRK